MTFVLPRPVRFTIDDANRAHEQWGSNCGPGAIAGILGMTLDELRPMMGDFEHKGYTNPTLMWDVLARLTGTMDFTWRLKRGARDWPTYGLARVQWEGPWIAPGVPARVAYRHTHWVGVMRVSEPLPRNVRESIGIFDINSMEKGGWAPLSAWTAFVVPSLLAACEPEASGKFHLTHVVEISLQ